MFTHRRDKTYLSLETFHSVGLNGKKLRRITVVSEYYKDTKNSIKLQLKILQNNGM